MSLQIWLPLNGNLNNQGLLDAPIMGSVNSWEDNGKIGKCAKGGSYYIPAEYMSNLLSDSNFSICFWYNNNGASHNRPICGTTGNGFTSATRNVDIFNWPDKCSLHMNGNFACFTLSNVIPDNEWVHICLTIDDTKMGKIYINGNLIYSFQGGIRTLTRDLNYYIGLDSNSDNSLNDFRIYDNCLSAREVKEISKALVLHYPLNQCERSENLVVNSVDTINWNDNIEYDCSGFGNNGNVLNNGLIKLNVNSPRKYCYEFAKSANRYISRQYLDFLTTPTFACWVYQTDRVTVHGNNTIGLQFIMSQGRDYRDNEIMSYGFNIVLYNGQVFTMCANTYDGTGVVLDLKKWYHLVYTFDGNDIVIWVNGKKIYTTNTNNLNWENSGGQFTVGKMSIGYGYTDYYFPFVGCISDVRVYNTALSDKDVQELYNTSVSITNNGTLMTQGEVIES